MVNKQESSKGSGAKWPRIVFVDTNVLYSLGSQFEHVDFAELLELRDILGFELTVPEVCWLEYLRQRRVEIETSLQNLGKAASLLRRLGLKIEQFSQAEQLLKEFDFEKHFGEKAKSLGITRHGLPAVDIHRLLKMAVDRIAPFQEAGEKGFRDSLILFTCLEAIRKKPELRALAITGDHKLREAFIQFAPEYQTEIDVVPSLNEAAKHIVTRMDEHYRERLRREAAEAKELLLRHREQIEKRVGEITEFSQFEISGFSSLDIGSVQQVLSLKFEDVLSAVWKERDKDHGRILFSVKATLTILATPFSFDSFNPTFQIGGEKTYRMSLPRAPVEKQIEKTLYGEATFIKKDDKVDMAELKIDKYIPDIKEFAPLFRVQAG